jgi:flagellar hook-associated protein FlgK
MGCMIDFSAPLAGLDRASKALDKVASRVAQAGNSGGDTVDLSAEAVALMVAQQNYQSNVKVIQTADQMTKSLLNLLG